MKRLPWRLVMIGAAVYIVTVIGLFPAGHAIALLAPTLEASGISLAAAGITGTIWSGSTASVSVNGSHIGGVDWRLRITPLLAGRLGVDWSARLGGDGFASGNTRIALDGAVTTTGLEAELPAEVVYARFPYLPVVPSGDLVLNLAELQLENGRLAGATGQATWRAAGLSVPQTIRFGELHLRVETSPDGEILGRVSDGGGPLSAEGTVTLSPEGRYAVDLLLSPGTDAENSLKQGLTLVGRPDARGRSRLLTSGQL